MLSYGRDHRLQIMLNHISMSRCIRPKWRKATEAQTRCVNLSPQWRQTTVLRPQWPENYGNVNSSHDSRPKWRRTTMQCLQWPKTTTTVCNSRPKWRKTMATQACYAANARNGRKTMVNIKRVIMRQSNDVKIHRWSAKTTNDNLIKRSVKTIKCSHVSRPAIAVNYGKCDCVKDHPKRSGQTQCVKEIACVWKWRMKLHSLEAAPMNVDHSLEVKPTGA